MKWFCFIYSLFIVPTVVFKRARVCVFVKYLLGTFQVIPKYSILRHSGSSRTCDETEDLDIFKPKWPQGLRRSSTIFWSDSLRILLKIFVNRRHRRSHRNRNSVGVQKSMQERWPEESKWNDKNDFVLKMRILFKTYSTKHCSSKWTAKTKGFCCLQQVILFSKHSFIGLVFTAVMCCFCSTFPNRRDEPKPR